VCEGAFLVLEATAGFVIDLKKGVMRNCDLRYCKTQLMDEAGKGEMMREDPNHGAYWRKKSSKTWQENEKGDVVTTPLERWWEREGI
jgi:hypothetical protein